MEIDQKQLLNELLTLRAFLANNPSSSSIKYEYTGFAFLNDLYCSLTGITIDEDAMWFDSKRANEILDRAYIKGNEKVIDYMENNLQTISDIFLNYDKKLKKAKFIYYPFENFKTFNEKDFKDIILSYYATYDNKKYSIVKKYFDEKRIETSHHDLEDFVSAAFGSSPGIARGYIMSSYDTFNTRAMTDLVHELGHAIDAETFIFPQQKAMTLQEDILCEIPSTAYEINFLHYLMRNNIDKKGALIIKNNLETYMNGNGVVYEGMLGEDSIEYDAFLNAYDQEDNCYPLKDMIMYDLAYYVSMHLAAIKDVSTKEYNKALFNIISTRNEMVSIDEIIKHLNIDKETFISGDIPLEYIKGEQEELKKLYPHYYGGDYEFNKK